jgi:hypothetical protein
MKQTLSWSLLQYDRVATKSPRVEQLKAFALLHYVVSQLWYSRNAFGESGVVELERLRWLCGRVDYQA